MIADALNIADCVEQILYQQMLTVVQGKVVDLDQIVCENRIQAVHLLLILKNFRAEGFVSVRQSCCGYLQVGNDNLSHIDNLPLCRVNGKGRRLQQPVVQMAQNVGFHIVLGPFILLFLYNGTGRLHKKPCKREQDDRIGHIENGVENRDPDAVCAGSRKGRIQKEHSKHDRSKKNRSEHIEQQMDHCRRAAGSHGGEQGRDTGSDILAQSDKYG